MLNKLLSILLKLAVITGIKVVSKRPVLHFINEELFLKSQLCVSSRVKDD